jgi:hypothetical protein
MILFAKERRHLPQKSHPILCCGRNLTEGYAPSTYTNKIRPVLTKQGQALKGFTGIRALRDGPKCWPDSCKAHPHAITSKWFFI